MPRAIAFSSALLIAGFVGLPGAYAECSGSYASLQITTAAETPAIEAAAEVAIEPTATDISSAKKKKKPAARTSGGASSSGTSSSGAGSRNTIPADKPSSY
jgi:hypothetical protein